MKSRREGNADLVLNNQGQGVHGGSIKTSKSPNNSATEPDRGGQLRTLAIELSTHGSGRGGTHSSAATAAQAKRIIARNAGRG